jgi:transposase InsO family protein
MQNGTKSNGSHPRSNRYTADQKRHTLLLVASGMEMAKAGRVIGATGESVRRWRDEAVANGTMPEVPTAAEIDAGDNGRATAVVPGRDTDVGVMSSDDDSAAEVDAEGVAPQTPASGSKLAQGVVAQDGAATTTAPQDPGFGLSHYEVDAILDLKGKHPAMQAPQIRAQLKRKKGWRLSVRAVDRVLRKHGYEPDHRGSRPKGPEPTRFEAPHRGALWQMDFTELRVGANRLYLLCALDDHSRFIVGHVLCQQAKTEVAVDLVRTAIAQHGKPEAIRTDRGGAFLARDGDETFTKVLEQELIEHIVGRPYHPQGGGKIEAFFGTLKRELWQVVQMDSVDHAKVQVTEFIDHYNHHRAHMGIDGLTPADRFFGRAQKVLALIDGISRRRAAALQQVATVGAPIEELLSPLAAAPTEVVRLMIVDGRLTLRLCGAQVDLGPIRPANIAA